MRLPVTLLISSALFVAVPAHAADPGFYLGAGIGQMNTQVDDVWDSGFDFDESDVGFKIFGGYRFLPWLAVEGAYVDGGSPEDKVDYGDGDRDSLAIEVKSLVAAAVFSLPLGERFELFLKPGIAYWDATTRLKYSYPSVGLAGSFSEDDDGSAFFLGAGGGYQLGENFGVRLEYEWFEVAPEWDSDQEEFVDELDGTAGFWSLSVLYRF